MRTRKTHDYSPLQKGSKTEEQAINARREMMNTFASRGEPVYEKSKWSRRMEMRVEKLNTGKAYRIFN